MFKYSEEGQTLRGELPPPPKPESPPPPWMNCPEGWVHPVERAAGRRWLSMPANFPLLPSFSSTILFCLLFSGLLIEQHPQSYSYFLHSIVLRKREMWEAGSRFHSTRMQRMPHEHFLGLNIGCQDGGGGCGTDGNSPSDTHTDL